MRLTPIAIALTATLLLTACADSTEDVPTGAPAVTATPSPAAAIVFCPRFGDGSTPTTPTPVPSCTSAPIVGDLSDVELQQTDSPPLPSGLVAASYYYTVQGGAAGLPATLSVRLLPGSFSTNQLAWFTFESDQWRRIDTPVSTIGPATNPDTAIVGTFDDLPPNLIVLAEPQ